MIRITKLTDYGIVLLAHIARTPQWTTRSVRELAADTHVPLPTVSKLLKTLTRKGLLVSHRGVKGGYALARRPEEISVAQVIDALDGPIAITECTTGAASCGCELEKLCSTRANWQRINMAIRDAMEGLTLADMARPLPASFIPLRSVTARVAHSHHDSEVATACPP